MNQIAETVIPMGQYQEDIHLLHIGKAEEQLFAVNNLYLTLREEQQNLMEHI